MKPSQAIEEGHRMAPLLRQGYVPTASRPWALRPRERAQQWFTLRHYAYACNGIAKLEGRR